MNKQELINKLEELIIKSTNEFDCGHDYGIRSAIVFAKQLDEPKKPVVPQFVADYIDSERNSCSTFSEAIDNMDDKQKILDWFYINSETFAKAWLYGYEIEKEKLYTVELPNPNAGGHVVLCKTSNGIVSISFTGMARWQGCKNFQLTEAEIKKDFDWAWKFRKEVKE